MIKAHDIKPNCTITELIATRDLWMEFAKKEQIPERVRAIVRAMGERIQEPYPNHNVDHWVLTKDGYPKIRVGVAENWLGYIPGFGFDKETRLFATSNGHNVCYWEWHTYEHAKPTRDLFFVNGVWIGLILSLEEEANQFIQSASKTKAENERAALMKQLLVGLEV